MSARNIEAGGAFVRLFTDKSPMVRGLKEARKDFDSWAAGLSKAGLALTAASGAGLAIAGAALKSYADAGSALNDMSLRTGVSIEALSKLKFVAEQNGSSLEGLEGGLKKYSKSLVAAQNGNAEALAGFSALGISMKDLNGKTAEEQMALIGDRLMRLPAGARRAAGAMGIFGKSGADLIPVLSDLRAGMERADRLGLGWTTEEAQNADALGDRFDELKDVAWRTVHVLANDLAPAVISVTEPLLDMAKAAKQWTKENPGVLTTVVATTAAVGALGTTLLAAGIGLTAAGVAASGFASAWTGIGTAIGGAALPMAALTKGTSLLTGTAGKAARAYGAFAKVVTFGGIGMTPEGKPQKATKVTAEKPFVADVPEVKDKAKLTKEAKAKKSERNTAKKAADEAKKQRLAELKEKALAQKQTRQAATAYVETTQSSAKDKAAAEAIAAKQARDRSEKLAGRLAAANKKRELAQRIPKKAAEAKAFVDPLAAAKARLTELQTDIAKKEAAVAQITMYDTKAKEDAEKAILSAKQELVNQKKAITADTLALARKQAKTAKTDTVLSTARKQAKAAKTASIMEQARNQVEKRIRAERAAGIIAEARLQGRVKKPQSRLTTSILATARNQVSAAKFAKSQKTAGILSLARSQGAAKRGGPSLFGRASTAGITATKTALGGLQAIVSPLTSSFGKLTGGISSGFKAASGSVLRFGGTLATALAPVLAIGAIAGIGYLIATETDIGKNAITGLKAAASTASVAIGIAADDMQGRLSEAWTVVSTEAVQGADQAVVAWGGITDAVAAGDLVLAGEIAMAGLEAAWRTGAATIIDTWTVAVSMVNEKWTNATSYMREVGERLYAWFSTLWIDIKGLAFSAFNAIANKFDRIISFLADVTFSAEVVIGNISAEDAKKLQAANKQATKERIAKRNEAFKKGEKSRENEKAEITTNRASGLKTIKEKREADQQKIKNKLDADLIANQKKKEAAEKKLADLRAKAGGAKAAADAKKQQEEEDKKKGEQPPTPDSELQPKAGGGGSQSEATQSGIIASLNRGGPAGSIVDPMVKEQKKTNEILSRKKEEPRVPVKIDVKPGGNADFVGPVLPEAERKKRLAAEQLAERRGRHAATPSIDEQTKEARKQKARELYEDPLKKAKATVAKREAMEKYGTPEQKEAKRQADIKKARDLYEDPLKAAKETVRKRVAAETYSTPAKPKMPDLAGVNIPTLNNPGASVAALQNPNDDRDTELLTNIRDVLARIDGRVAVSGSFT